MGRGDMGRGDWKGYLWIRWVEYVEYVECGKWNGKEQLR